MLVIKYEDLLCDPERELRRFCQFIGISRETGHLTAVAKAASFANLRAKEARMGYGRSYHNFPPDTFFFRRGVVGSHKDEMPPEVLERFLEHAGDTLRRCGYATGELENRRLADEHLITPVNEADGSMSPSPTSCSDFKHATMWSGLTCGLDSVEPIAKRGDEALAGEKVPSGLVVAGRGRNVPGT